jgi:hypothetical protein
LTTNDNFIYDTVMNKKSSYRWYRQTEAGAAVRKQAREKYRKSEKGRAAGRRYAQSERGKLARKKWAKSEKGRATTKRLEEKHRKSEKGKATTLRYNQSERGRLVAARSYRKHCQKCRNIVIMHYGGDPPKCACCDESHYEFLTIDHINGGGEKDRKARGGGTAFYRSLIRDGFPLGLRVLCYNCHLARGFSGYCPHQPRPG